MTPETLIPAINTTLPHKDLTGLRRKVTNNKTILLNFSSLLGIPFTAEGSDVRSHQIKTTTVRSYYIFFIIAFCILTDLPE